LALDVKFMFLYYSRGWLLPGQGVIQSAKVKKSICNLLIAKCRKMTAICGYISKTVEVRGVVVIHHWSS